MTTDEAKDLISTSSLSEALKSDLLGMLGSEETVSAATMTAITNALQQQSQSLKTEINEAESDFAKAEADLKEDPEAVKALEGIDEEFSKVDAQAKEKIDMAYQEFSDTMEEIDTEAKDVSAELSKVLDEEEIAAVKDDINA